MKTNALAVWGSPGVGKTTTALKIALELGRQKKNTVLLCCDFIAPVPQLIQPNVSTKGKSLGDLLAMPTISQEVILQHLIPLNATPYVSVLGYGAGDNGQTYASYQPERASDLLFFLQHIAEFLIVDCSSIFFYDTLSAVALSNVDVLRLCSCNLKSVSYFSSQLPLLADARFRVSRHTKALSQVVVGQDSGEYSNYYGGTSYTLPYVRELEEQFFSGRLQDDLTSKEAAVFKEVLQTLTTEMFLETKETKPNKILFFGRKSKSSKGDEIAEEPREKPKREKKSEKKSKTGSEAGGIMNSLLRREE
jgi:DNA polymerase III delta prime subunit